MDAPLLTDTARSLSKDTLATVTDVNGNVYDGKVTRFNTHAGEYDISDASIVDADTFDPLARVTIVPDGAVSVRPLGTNSPTERIPVESIETHGIQVDWDEPVKNEFGLTYVVDCPECGGLMTRNGQHWPRSAESYKCHECDHTGHWRRRSDAVRSPTRREWALHKLNKRSPFISLPERYVPEGYSLPGHYFREACSDDPTHYQRCRVDDTEPATYSQYDDLKLGVCPECGAETTIQTLRYEAGLNEWGEPEDHGERFSEQFTAALDAVQTGEFALFIPDSDEVFSYTYEGIDYVSPWHGWEDGVFIVVDDEKGLIKDIVGKGYSPVQGGSCGTDFGEVSWWFEHADDAELVTRAEYERRINVITA